MHTAFICEYFHLRTNNSFNKREYLNILNFKRSYLAKNLSERNETRPETLNKLLPFNGYDKKCIKSCQTQTIRSFVCLT